MKGVIAFGELLWDLFPAGRELGGAPANFAYRTSALGHASFLLSAVGEDELGREALRRLSECAVNTSFVQARKSLPTGRVEITLNPNGDPNFRIITGVAYDSILCTPGLEVLAQEAHCIYFGTLAQRSETNRDTLSRLLGAAAPGTMRVLDLNLRPDCFTPQTLEHSLQNADVLKLNDHEVGVLAELFGLPAREQEFSRAACDRWQLTHCAVTRGERGVYARTAEGEECSLPGVPVNVVDTCGAGDAFTAGFTSQLLEGADLERCCRFGNALGALVASTRGAMAPIPREQVEEFVRRAE